jgi:hypothetical protein
VAQQPLDGDETPGGPGTLGVLLLQTSDGEPGDEHDDEDRSEEDPGEEAGDHASAASSRRRATVWSVVSCWCCGRPQPRQTQTPSTTA